MVKRKKKLCILFSIFCFLWDLPLKIWFSFVCVLSFYFNIQQSEFEYRKLIHIFTFFIFTKNECSDIFKKKISKFVGAKTNGSLIKGGGGEYWLWRWMWVVDLDLVWVLNLFAYGWLADGCGCSYGFKFVTVGVVDLGWMVMKIGCRWWIWVWWW